MVRQPLRHPSTVPLVVKLGGSLRDRLPDLVPVLLASRRPLFIVPGGGIFADTVRKANVNEESAHWMAIAAMDQYGWCIASRGIPATTALCVPDRTVVFLPYSSMRCLDPLPHSWNITSDSIAAWAADFLRLDLLVLKSVDGIIENGILLERVSLPVENKVVDPHFIPFVLEKNLKTIIINGSHCDRIERFLKGEAVPGTGIGTTF